MGLTNVTEELWVGGAAMGEVLTGFAQAQLAVDCEADFEGVRVFLAVVLPPANRAQPQCVRGFQGLVSAAGATEPGNDNLHG
jgi:hypothetical protein